MNTLSESPIESFQNDLIVAKSPFQAFDVLGVSLCICRMPPHSSRGSTAGRAESFVARWIAGGVHDREWLDRGPIGAGICANSGSISDRLCLKQSFWQLPQRRRFGE